MSAENPIDFNKYITGQEALSGATRSTRTLGKAVTAIAGTVEADSKRIATALLAVDAAVRAIQAKGQGLKLVDDNQRKELADLLKQVNDLKGAKALLKESEKAQAAAMLVVTDAAKQQTTALQQQKEALRQAIAANDVAAQQKAAAAIRQTAQENNQLSRALRGVNSEFTAAKGSYDALTIANGRLLANLRGLEGGLKADSKEAEKLRIEIAANTSTLTAFDKQLGQNFRNVGNYPKLTQQLGAGVSGLVQNLGGAYLGLAGVGNALREAFEANVKYSDQAADVRKTTGLSADEFDRLADSLKELDTPTSLSGLLDIAKVAGQLGIAKGDVLDFTKAIDTAVQALGDDFTGGADQIATELGKISGVFRKELGPDVAKNILSIGSAVNEIGAEGAATAPFLTDVALRVGAIAAQTGVGLKNVLAYGAVLQEMGFSAETSGTALNKLFSVLSTKTEESFRIAQKANPALTLKEFTHLVNTDFNQAIQVFLKGLNAGGKSTTEQAALLKTLKLQSGEAKNVIITLAQNTDLFAQRQKTANDQLRDATSLAAEAAVKNDTLSGSVSKLKNDVTEFTTGGAATSFLKFLVDFVRQSGPYLAFVALAIKYNTKLIEGYTAIGEKLGLITKPQVDYTVAIVANNQALTKQAQAGQTLLDSYTKLALATTRTAAQEIELADLREKLRKQYGTADVDLIQARIKAQQEGAASDKRTLESNLAAQDAYLEKVQQQTATLQQDATTAQEAFANRFKISPEGIKNIQEAARAGALANALAGRSFPKEQVDAAKELNRTQDALAESTKRYTAAQLTRAQIAAALAKLSPVAVKANQDEADSADDAAASERELDRAGKERAKNRVQALRDELAGNERSIAEIRKIQAEQGKLFEDKQITEAIFAQSVAGSEDLVTQLQRNGAAIRIQIARAETAEKLKEADNDRIRQLNKKKITQAEVTDIEAQYSERRKEIYRKEGVEIQAIQRETRERLKVDPIEFKVAGIDPKALKQAEIDLDLSGDRLNEKLKGIGAAAKRQYDADAKAKEDAEETKRKAQALTLELAQAGIASLFQLQANALQAQADAENASYDRSIKNAGENAELKAKIEEDHQKKIGAIRLKQARAERAQAIFSILINTAKAIVTTIGEFGFPLAIPFIAAEAAVAAIQTAAVLSAPLPQYFTGRRGGEAVPLASVAERGPELIHRKNTDRFEYVETPSLTSLGRGDDVYTAAESRQILLGAAMRHHDGRQPVQVGSSLAAATAAIQAGRVDGLQMQQQKQANAEITKAINAQTAVLGRLKQLHVNVDNAKGVSIQQGYNLTTYLNGRFPNLGA